MKKIGTVLLAAMMILSLGACAGGNEPAVSGNNTESSQNSAAQSNASEESRTPEDSQEPAASETLSETETENRQSGTTPEVSAINTGASTEVSASEPSPAPDGTSSNSGNGTESSKILVAYFSATNNTEGVAQKLADGLGADLYEITPAQPYTDEDLDYGNSQSRSSVEMDDPSARPAISGSVENMDQYDVVFIGYPIWWGEAPRIMSTFIESYDFSGKTLAAFCTSASSGFGNSDSALQSAANGATWLEGHRFSAGASADDVMEWANGLGIN